MISVKSMMVDSRKRTYGVDGQSLTIERRAQLIVLEFCSASVFLFHSLFGEGMLLG